MIRSLVLALTVVSAAAHAQSPDVEIRATIDRLFDGMRAADTTAMRATLHPTARLMTALDQGGERSVAESPIAAFLAAVAGASVTLDEQISDTYPVLVDDGLAVAWTPYRFYAGGAFSHCGTNAFVLALGTDGWQIVHIMDTRRRACPGPEEPRPDAGD